MTAVVRTARAEDRAARCELFSRVGMDSDVALSVHRAPDLDALYRLQSLEWQPLVVELDGAVEGTSAIVVRDCWLGGKRSRVGYLGDLRFSNVARGRQILDRFYAPILRDAAASFSCDLFLTAVIASNETAMRGLVHQTPRSRRAGRPIHTLLREFAIRSIHLLPPRLQRRSTWLVRHASAADIPAIASMLDDDGRRRPFGYTFSVAELARRLESWPGLSIDSFLVAEDRTGALLGCIAPWDAAPVKRTVVREYRGRMQRVRIAYDVAARLLGRARLPRPGAEFRYLYVTHQAIPSGDSRILRALLDVAYVEARRSGYHFMSICAPRGDPLEAASRGFFKTDLTAGLYLVTAPETPIPPSVVDSPFPGFEMALV